MPAIVFLFKVKLQSIFWFKVLGNLMMHLLDIESSVLDEI